MAGIKFHGAVDTEISGNHIHHTCLGIWLDWMAQGTRVSRNVLHDNGPSHDVFVEVNHGPFLVDNNIMLSNPSMLVNSQGGAYVHNLIAGQVNVLYGEQRETPYLKAHSTEVAGLAPNRSGDERYFNNVFLKYGLFEYDRATLPVFMSGNVFLNGARPSKHEADAIVNAGADPGIQLMEKDDGTYLRMVVERSWMKGERQLVKTQLLGRAFTPQLPYEMPDGTAYVIGKDFLGEDRDVANPKPGPFEFKREGGQVFKVR
jgi:alpha-N-arabinofuranosidase